jgi:glycosyltransferase involved in cell wall biosynthesis
VGRVTVALPVLDGGELLDEVLGAVRAQRVDRRVELLVCDSGSTDGSPERAAAHGARVLRIPNHDFGHGRTRNLLAREAAGEHVVFLTQDATPAHDGWLQAHLDGFRLAPDVALTTGPYLPRPGAPLHLRRELAAFFGPHDAVEVHRLADAGPEPLRPSFATFHTDANGGLAKAAWAAVPFRDVPYAEDQGLALDVLRAGRAKAWIPEAAVVHSHAYRPLEQARRHLDEFRGLRDVYGHRESARLRAGLGRVRRETALDRAFGRREGLDGAALDRATLASLRFHALRWAASVAARRA